MRYLGKIEEKQGCSHAAPSWGRQHHTGMLPSYPSHCHWVWVVFWALAGYRSEVAKLGKHMVQNSASRQLWNKLRNRLRTITTLVIVGQKWVIMCPHVVQAQITITLCTSNIWTWINKRQLCVLMLYRHELLLQCVHEIFQDMNTQEATIPSGNCTPGRPEQLRSVLSCHSLGFLLSVLCRAMLSCFCLGLLLPYLHFHGWTRRIRVRIRPYQLLYSVRIRPCLLHVRIADRIKNGGPYRRLSLTRAFLACKRSLSIADHLRATFINRSTCQAYIETLKMPLTHKQPKKWWTNRQTDK